MKDIHCSNPRIIVNPKLPELLFRFRHWVLNGVEHKNKYYNHHMYDFLWHDFSVKLNHITKDNYLDSYVIDDASGETYNIYLAVPCGHCDICKVSKINSFVKRCQYESQMYKFYPWFVTLTYAHDPGSGVCVRDVQLFMKRFRINLLRHGFNFKVRYVIVAEYGKTTHRAHYHCIFWNINSGSHQTYCEVKKVLLDSWSHGFIVSRLIDPRNDKGFYYTSKYLKKDCVVPEGKNDTFVLSSRGNGGIGSPFIDSIKDNVRKSLNVEYKFLNKWTGKVEVIQWSSYVLNRIFPSFCRSVDRLFRNAVQDYVYYFNNYLNFGCFFGKELCKYEISLRNRLSKYFFIPTNFEQNIPKHGIVKADYLESLKSFIESKINTIDFDLATKIDTLRHLFLGRLFLHESFYDLDFRKRKCAEILSWESPRTQHV